MNPYFYATIMGAASATKRPRPARRTLKRKRRSPFVRVGIILALMIAFFIGLLLFSFVI